MFGGCGLFFAFTTTRQIRRVTRAFAPTRRHVQICLTAIDFKNLGRHSIEHMAVVRDEQQAAVVISQPFFEVGNGIKIEMVGGFVQDERFPFANQ